MFGLNIRLAKAVVLLCFFATASCTALYQNHGYVPADDELNELVVGVDSRATVDDVIGPPTASGVLSDGDYYYIRSRVRTYGMFKPEVVERQVLAISFDEADTVANIERFSLADGSIVPLSRRVTDSSVISNGFLRQLLGNLGQFDPSDLFN